MAQNITLTIAGKQYNMSAGSQNEEEAMRKSADRINRLYEKVSRSAPLMPREDILAMVALTRSVEAFNSEVGMKGMEDGIRQISDRLDAYLQDK